MQALLDQGADFNIPNVNGQTPVFAAAYFGQLGTLKLLVEARASLTAAPISGDGEGQTVLQIAEEKAARGKAGYAEVVMCLKQALAQGTHPPPPPSLSVGQAPPQMMYMHAYATCRCSPHCPPSGPLYGATAHPGLSVHLRLHYSLHAMFN
jgi:hypothetical protein